MGSGLLKDVFVPILVLSDLSKARPLLLLKSIDLGLSALKAVLIVS